MNIVVEVKHGRVQRVYASEVAEVIVVDHDTPECDPAGLLFSDKSTAADLIVGGEEINFITD